MPIIPSDDITVKDSGNTPSHTDTAAASTPDKVITAAGSAASPVQPQQPSAKEVAAATNLSRLFRGRQARKKYALESIPPDKMSDYKAFLYGNDPSFTADLLRKDLEIRPNRETPFVFIGMACLKNLSVVLALAAQSKPSQSSASNASPLSVGTTSPVSVGTASPIAVGSESPVPVGSASPVPVGSASPLAAGTVSPVPVVAASPVPFVQSNAVVKKNTTHLDTLPRLLIIDNSKHVKNFWSVLKNYFAKMDEKDFLKNLMDVFVDELSTNDVFTDGDIMYLKQYLSDLFVKYGYESVKALVERVKFVGQDWADEKTFKVIKNLVAFGDAASKGAKTVVYAYPSNIPSCCVKLEEDNATARKVLANLNVLKPDVAIHSNLEGRTGRMRPTKVHLVTDHNPDNVAKILDLPLASAAAASPSQPSTG